MLRRIKIQREHYNKLAKRMNVNSSQPKEFGSKALLSSLRSPYEFCEKLIIEEVSKRQTDRQTDR